jgi:hypothetical protein
MSDAKSIIEVTRDIGHGVLISRGSVSLHADRDRHRR